MPSTPAKPTVAPALYAKTQAAQKALQTGQKESALVLLREVVTVDARVELAWWLLAQHTSDPREEWQALERVLALNPEHAVAESRRMRLHQQVLQQALAANSTDWKKVLPEVPLEPPDLIDDPYQCPACGSVAGEKDRRCPTCGQGLFWQVPRPRNVEQMNAAQIVMLLLVLLGGVQLFSPFFALTTASNTGLLPWIMMFDWVGWFIGDFTKLSTTTATWLLAILLARGGWYALALLGLRAHVRPGLYGAIIVAFLDVGWNFFLLLSGFIGVVLSLIIIGLAMAALTILFGLFYEFETHEERILVRPVTRAKGAADFYRLGLDYSERGLWALAVAQWRKAVGLAPGQTAYYRQLGIGYAHIGRYDRSLRVLAEAQRQAPNDPKLPELIKLIQAEAAKAKPNAAR